MDLHTERRMARQPGCGRHWQPGHHRGVRGVRQAGDRADAGRLHAGGSDQRTVGDRLRAHTEPARAAGERLHDGDRALKLSFGKNFLEQRTAAAARPAGQMTLDHTNALPAALDRFETIAACTTGVARTHRWIDLSFRDRVQGGGRCYIAKPEPMTAITKMSSREICLSGAGCGSTAPPFRSVWPGCRRFPHVAR